MSYGEISSTTTRFTGMESGLDVDSIVEGLMKAEQLKIDAISQKKTLLEWKKDAYNEVNSLVTDFMNKHFSAASSDTSISMNASYTTKRVIASNNQYAAITASATAFDGSYTINSITSLASGANSESITGVSASSTDKISATASLKDLNLVTPLEFEAGVIAFNINGVDFSFNDTDTLQNVINTVNRSSAGVTMSYSSLSDKISVKSKTLGIASEINITNTSGNFFADAAGDSAFGLTAGLINNGTNAVLNINGYDVEQTSNTFTIDGISYNLLQPTNIETSFTVSQDIDSIYNRIKGFIDGYNELITALDSKISEERYRTYLPLTDAQRSAMKEKDIEAWEKKSKSGLLRSDNNIRKLLTDIRNAFSEAVEGVGITFAEIGITTGKWVEKGRIHINETKFKDALANNTEAVTDLFIKNSSSIDQEAKYKESGLVQRINNSMKSYTNHVNSVTLSYTAKQISGYSDKVKSALSKLTQKENYYYKQYAALETALSKLYSQSSYFTSLLYGGK